ncbi:hypothetical protein REPUB_Repub04eG0123700 [Reevesia pubescens]
MKLFSELGSCCCSSTSTASSYRKMEGGATQVSPLLSSCAYHAKRMNKLGGTAGSASSAARHWRPGLQAIREDNIVLDLEGKVTERKTLGENNKSKGRYMSKPHRVTHNDDSYSRNNSAPMIIPPFSPTPFMF